MRRSGTNREQEVSKRQTRASVSLSNLAEVSLVARQHEVSLTRARESELMGTFMSLERASEKRSSSLMERSRGIRKSEVCRQKKV